MKINKVDLWFWRFSFCLCLTMIIGLAGITFYSRLSEYPPSEVVSIKPNVVNDEPKPFQLDNQLDNRILNKFDKQFQKIESQQLALFTLDFRYSITETTRYRNLECTSSTKVMAEYVAYTLKQAWELIPGKIQLRFPIDKIIYCQNLIKAGKPYTWIQVTHSEKNNFELFFTLPENLNKSPKALKGYFLTMLFKLGEQQFGHDWAIDWEQHFGRSHPENSLNPHLYESHTDERADWFRLLLLDKNNLLEHISLTKNETLLAKLLKMREIIDEYWHLKITFSPMKEEQYDATQISTLNKDVTQKRPSEIKTLPAPQHAKNLSAKEAEDVFGIRGLQFASNKFAPELPFKLGFAHTNIDVLGNTCFSSTPLNTAFNGRHLISAWEKIPATTQKRLNLKFVFFCSNITSPKGVKIGGLTASYLDTVFINIPEYRARSAKFIEKIFLHELFHYAEYRRSRFHHQAWDSVFMGYADAYREDLSDSHYGSGKRGFINAYAMTFSAEDRAELFSELMLNSEKVKRFAQKTNDTVLKLKIARMQQIMRVNWGIFI